MLYAIQQTISLTKFRAQLQAAHPETAAKEQAPADALSRVQDYPGFEQEFGINPGGDVDAETGWTLHKADEEAELRQPQTSLRRHWACAPLGPIQGLPRAGLSGVEHATEQHEASAPATATR